MALCLCGRLASGRPIYYMTATGYRDGCFVQAGVSPIAEMGGTARRGTEATAAFLVTVVPDLVEAGYTPGASYTVTLSGDVSGLAMLGGTAGAWSAASTGSTVCQMAEQTGACPTGPLLPRRSLGGHDVTLASAVAKQRRWSP